MRPQGRLAALHALLTLLPLLLPLLLAGCRTPPAPPLDLHGPGWLVRQGQAVWTAGEGEQGVAGELLVACGPGGACFVQFAKPPFTIVTAQAKAETWTVEMPQARRRFEGRSRAPAQFVWFALAEAISGETLGAGWQFKRAEADGWRLANPATGESLEGYFTP